MIRIQLLILAYQHLLLGPNLENLASWLGFNSYSYHAPPLKSLNNYILVVSTSGFATLSLTITQISTGSPADVYIRSSRTKRNQEVMGRWSTNIFSVLLLALLYSKNHLSFEVISCNDENTMVLQDFTPCGVRTTSAALIKTSHFIKRIMETELLKVIITL